MWEYHVEIVRGVENRGTWSYNRVLIEGTFNQLGKDNWELVTKDSMGRHAVFYIFKRRVGPRAALHSTLQNLVDVLADALLEGLAK